VILLARHTVRLLAQLVLAGARTGRWWMPILVPLLALAALLIAATKVVVPTAVYVFF
jgi:hypothetical protein